MIWMSSPWPHSPKQVASRRNYDHSSDAPKRPTKNYPAVLPPLSF